MKYFGLVFSWSAAIGLVLFLSTSSLIQADPTDDFSFTLGHAPEVEVYSLMSERRVAEILRDRLDFFPESQIPKLAHHLVSLCRTYRFDPAFVLSLIQVESRFRTRVVSGAGAVGLMQLMPATANTISREMELFPGRGSLAERALTDPFVNLTVGVAYLAWLRDHYQGQSPYYLVAAYNIGPAKMDELLSRKSFKPVNTKKYFEAIRRGVPSFRFYQRKQKPAPQAPGSQRWQYITRFSGGRGGV